MPLYERTALSDGLDAAIHPLFDLDVVDAVQPPHRGVLHAFRDVFSEIRDVRDASDRVDGGTRGEIERSPGARWLDHDFDRPASARVVAPTEDFDLYASADPPQERQKDAGKIVDGGRPSDVGSALDSQADRLVSSGCNGEAGLEDEGHAPRRTDVERVTAAGEGAGPNRDLLRSHRKPVDLTIAEGRHRSEGGDMLRREAGRRPTRTNPHDPHGHGLRRAEGDRHTEELPPTLPMRPVDLHHGREALIRRRTTLSASTNANAVKEMRRVSSQSPAVSGSVWKTPWRKGV